MFLVPFLGAGVERDVARGGVGVFAELADTGVRILPIDLLFARHDGVANFVSVVIGKRDAGIDRPAAVVDAGVLLP